MITRHATTWEIRHQRSIRDMTVQEAADSIGVSRRTWTYWESGQRGMKRAILKVFEMQNPRCRDSAPKQL